ncbi:hypothetical protein VOLCADRAFT_87280 [Volvox carteri f. nagariensis]|uniref:Uncharacterized protein n=1 Tax=Volvox carteri f. nagariensis TaxID=3068 RepID=D8TKX4_VOLCA|nr:uncharacterized protein VOLCADRAFT_87280 [Volvox carteri f. nagariensis]EFJ51638.1 hypothetical protein VOLCADRAFT_87280 [Volvox carteri f. nagariensis]|eukprot:XP_002947048.1 hypothetical protein VOLCADRAFT_87280 [Volvox carteri f. nagariensis]
MEELAQLAVALHGSAVADSSSVTYKSGRRRFVRFCAEVAGVPEADALPRQRGSDLNRDLVCLFIAHAVGRYATSTVTGTLSALADWQRFMGVSPEAYISRDTLVKRTLGQVLRRTAAGPESAPSMAKAPLPLGVLRLLVAWLRATTNRHHQPPPPTVTTNRHHHHHNHNHYHYGQVSQAVGTGSGFRLPYGTHPWGRTLGDALVIPPPAYTTRTFYAHARYLLWYVHDLLANLDPLIPRTLHRCMQP